MKMEIEGLIEDFYLPPDLDFDLEEGWIEIVGLDQRVFIDGNTEREGTLAEGVMVEVEAVVQPDNDGRLLATEIEVEDVGDTDDEDVGGTGEGEEGELTLQVVAGEVTSGESITILVTSEGNAVPGALDEVNDEDIGETNGDGLISFIVPDEDELEIKAVKDELQGKLEIDFEQD